LLAVQTVLWKKTDWTTLGTLLQCVLATLASEVTAISDNAMQKFQESLKTNAFFGRYLSNQSVLSYLFYLCLVFCG
jgi:hypothetical protein